MGFGPTLNPKAPKSLESLNLRPEVSDTRTLVPGAPRTDAKEIMALGAQSLTDEVRLGFTVGFR